MTTKQEERLLEYKIASGASGAYNEVKHLALAATTGATGTTNELLLLALRTYYSDSTSGLAELQARFAQEFGASNWSALGSDVSNLLVSPVFAVDLLSDAGGTDAYGSTLTFTRASSAYLPDHLGVLRKHKTNELPICGLRRVENLLSASHAPATQTLTSLPAGNYVLQCEGTGEISASGATDGSYGSLTVAGNRKRLAITVTAAQNVTITVTSAPSWMMLENSSGLADVTLPSEEVNSATTYNANVAGVRLYATANGNTVDGSSVVTAGTGAALTLPGFAGAMAEASATNLATSAAYRTFTTGAGWVAVGTAPSASKNITGIDGVANAGTTLTDSTTGSQSGLSLAVAVPNDGVVRTVTCYLRKDAVTSRAPRIMAEFSGGTVKDIRLQVNTSTGASFVGNGGNGFCAVIDHGDWWWCMLIIGNNSLGNTTFKAQIIPCFAPSPGAVEDPNLTGSLGIDWLTMGQIAALESSIDGAATRAAQTFEYSIPLALQSAVPYAMAIKFLANHTRLFDGRLATAAVDASNHIRWAYSSTSISVAITIAGATTTLSYSVTTAINSTYAACLRVKVGGTELWINGAQRATTTAVTAANIPRATTLSLSDSIDASRIRSVLMDRGSVTDARCVELST